MCKVGWSITQNTFKYFWSLYLLEEENSGKKKNNSKSAGRAKIDNFHSAVSKKSQDISVSASSPDERKTNEHTDEAENSASDVQNFGAKTNELQNNANENHSSGKSAESYTQQNSAHFDLPPDSEDL